MDNDTQNSEETTAVDDSGMGTFAADGGFTSRKLWFGIGTSIAIVGGGVFYAFVDGFRNGYETYIMGLLGVLGLYVGGNVTHKFALAKHVANVATANIASQSSALTAVKTAASKPQPKPPVEPLPE